MVRLQYHFSKTEFRDINETYQYKLL